MARRMTEIAMVRVIAYRPDMSPTDFEVRPMCRNRYSWHADHRRDHQEGSGEIWTNPNRRGNQRPARAGDPSCQHLTVLRSDYTAAALIVSANEEPGLSRLSYAGFKP